MKKFIFGVTPLALLLVAVTKAQSRISLARLAEWNWVVDFRLLLLVAVAGAGWSTSSRDSVVDALALLLLGGGRNELLAAFADPSFFHWVTVVKVFGVRGYASVFAGHGLRRGRRCLHVRGASRDSRSENMITAKAIPQKAPPMNDVGCSLSLGKNGVIQ